MGSAPFYCYFWAVNPPRCFLCLYTSFFYFILLLSPFFPSSVSFFRCVSHMLSLLLSSCLACIPPLIGLPLLRSLLRSILCGCFLFVSFVCALVCVFRFLLIATMSFAGYFLVRSLLSAFTPFLRACSRFGLVWLRLSCDHGWIRSDSINVR